MKTKTFILLLCIGIFAILYSTSSLELLAEESGGGQFEYTVDCTCNYGPHDGEIGKKKKCSLVVTETACIRDMVWNREYQRYDYLDTYSPTDCKVCSYPDCSGLFCAPLVNPE